MSIDWTKPVQTKDGVLSSKNGTIQIWTYSSLVDLRYPVVGKIFTPDHGWVVAHWTSEGWHSHFRDKDLINPPEEKEVTVYLYKTRSTGSKWAGTLNVDLSGQTIVGSAKVKLIEGVFADE